MIVLENFTLFKINVLCVLAKISAARFATLFLKQVPVRSKFETIDKIAAASIAAVAFSKQDSTSVKVDFEYNVKKQPFSQVWPLKLFAYDVISLITAMIPEGWSFIG